MATKKAPAKKEAVQEQKEVESQPVEKEESQKTQPVEKEESKAVEQLQDESTQETKKKVSKPERVITILSSDDSRLLSQFEISRSAVSRAILRGSMDFMSQFASKKDVTEQEITEALKAKLS